MDVRKESVACKSKSGSHLYNLLLCVDVSHLIFFRSCLLSSMFMLYLSCCYFKDRSFNFLKLYKWKHAVTVPSK